MQLEADPQCQFDWIKVFDGPIADSNTLLGKFCGSSVPAAMSSTQRAMRIVLHTDSSIASDRFALTWSFAEPSML